MTGSTVHTVRAERHPQRRSPSTASRVTLDPWIGRVGTWSINDIPLFMVTNRDTLFVNRNGERYATEAPTWPMNVRMAGWRATATTASPRRQRLQELADNGFDHTNTNVFKHHGFNTFPHQHADSRDVRRRRRRP